MVKEKPEIADESGDKYKYGFVTDIAADTAPKGLNEDIIRLISRKKGEPEWLLEWRLKAFEFWQTMTEPSWAKLSYEKIDYQDLYYYSAPKQKAAPKSLDEVDAELLKTYEKLGIPLKERKRWPASLRSTRFLTAFPSPPLIAPNWPKWALSSVQSPKP